MGITEETRAAMKRDRRSFVSAEMPPPVVVIEGVSPGEPGSSNYDRDYIEKRREYAARGIGEYWLVDPDRHWVMVLSLNPNQDEEVGVFRGGERIISPTSPTLELTAGTVLSAGES